MSKHCRRNLNTLDLAEDFVLKIIEPDDGVDEIVSSIVNAELTVAQLEAHPTITHTDYRARQYRTDSQRNKLQEQVLRELINESRLESDEDIKLGVGGSKPSITNNESQAYIVMGPPASGKSGVAVDLSVKYGAYILDSDYAKRKLPEYHMHSGGASLVHAEADKIVFDPTHSLFVYCIYSRHNMVIPLVGRSVSSIEDIIKKLIEANYTIHIFNIVLDRFKCTARAYNRYIATHRYVPLSYVFDEVGNEPERIYFIIKRKYLSHPNFAGFSQLSTDVGQGEPPKIIETSELVEASVAN